MTRTTDGQTSIGSSSIVSLDVQNSTGESAIAVYDKNPAAPTFEANPTTNTVKISNLTYPKNDGSTGQVVGTNGYGLLSFITKDLKTPYSFRVESTGTDYNLIDSDHVVKFSTTSNITVYLPVAAIYSGREFIIIKTGTTGTLTISTTGGNNIDGSVTTFNIKKQFNKISLVSDGVNSWYIL
jgi:hypothetical protein